MRSPLFVALTPQLSQFRLTISPYRSYLHHSVVALMPIRSE